ncbi:MAG: class I SAM-dependent methyltransferase [Prochloraceae cyanobacterium]|nr:class I SAM-dependent methyltransferase [Prochloraceae cyanobacterium]
MKGQSLLQNPDRETRNALAEYVCPNCSHKGLLLFYEVNKVPVHSCLMMPTKQEALDFPCGDVVLGFCDRCGFITNVEFDPKWSAYAPNYEDQQSFSPTFNKFALDLANSLIEKYDLHDKDIVEIGCSKGDFLMLLCELGNNRGTGIDPSAVVGRVKSKAADRVTFIQDYYSEKYAKYVGDFICCRHTLEHIHPTAEFISTVRRSIGDRLNTAVVFEIPDTVRVLKDLAFEDIYYEHCSYFTPGSLARLFRSCGFEVTDLYRAYGEQYLLIEAKPAANPSNKVHPLEESLEELTQDVKHFASQIGKKLEHWKQSLEQIQAQGKRCVVWGSGSKCVAFLTTLDTADKIEYVVDINPHRHGKFIPGVGKQIMPPEFLKEYKPDRVIVMNPIYCGEIQQMLTQMGVTTEVISL